MMGRGSIASCVLAPTAEGLSVASLANVKVRDVELRDARRRSQIEFGDED